MKPGASADGTVGVDIFVGEAAVVAYVIEAGLLVAEDEADGNGHKDEGQSHSEDEGQHEEQDNEDGELTEDLVRASQINTSVELSQRTMDAMFGSPTPSEVALSQGAVARAFDLVQDDVSEPDILNGVSQLQHLSGASGAERVDSDVPEARQLRPRRQFKPDVDYVEQNECPSDYEQLSSGESDGDMISDSDDDRAEPRRIDEDDDVISDTDALELDEAFLASLSIGDDAELTREAVARRQEVLRTMSWTEPSSNFEFADAYAGLTGEEAAPVAELRSRCHSPLETFFFFAPKSMWINICEETNRYCAQQILPRAERIRAMQTGRRGTPTETVKQIRRRLRMKPAYATHELLHVIGLLVAQMLRPPRRRFAQHWSMTEDGAVPAGTF
ncbi:hypothetical protein F444_15272, partial [Phytophthora nicotianae P1976]